MYCMMAAYLCTAQQYSTHPAWQYVALLVPSCGHTMNHNTTELFISPVMQVPCVTGATGKAKDLLTL